MKSKRISLFIPSKGFFHYFKEGNIDFFLDLVISCILVYTLNQPSIDDMTSQPKLMHFSVYD